MRSRQEIVDDPHPFDVLTLEVLLDIRELLTSKLTYPEQEGQTCPECGRACKGKFGLQAHMRKHKRGKREGMNAPKD